MALNFPNNPTSGQTHTGVNNIEYRYDGEKWITLGSANVAGTDPTFDSLTVNGTGSFGGDLTLGTDKITLNASDGSATFAGDVNGKAITSTYGLYNRRVSGVLTNHIECTTDGFNNFKVDPSGNVEIGSSSQITLLSDGSATFAGNITAGNVSDIKFKENITDANPQLSDVVALGSNLKNWDWKEEAPLNDELKSKRFLGLIAQEAEQICPGVTYEVGEGEDSYKAINHDILVMKLLGAVTELKAEINELKANQP